MLYPPHDGILKNCVYLMAHAGGKMGRECSEENGKEDKNVFAWGLLLGRHYARKALSHSVSQFFKGEIYL